MTSCGRSSRLRKSSSMSDQTKIADHRPLFDSESSILADFSANMIQADRSNGDREEHRSSKIQSQYLQEPLCGCARGKWLNQHQDGSAIDDDSNGFVINEAGCGNCGP